MSHRYCNSLITNWKENLYLVSIGAFLVALPTSIALISCTSVALLIVWILTGDYKTKWNRLIHNKNALLLMSIPVIYLIGLCFTHHFKLGIQEFNKSLYWFIFAFVLGSSAPISHKNSCRLISIYIIAVTIAAGVALFKLMLLDTVFFFDFRSVTWIDHIPFSYQIAFAIWLIFFFIYKGDLTLWRKLLLLILLHFLVIALFSLKSFTGYLYFGVMSFTAVIMLIWETKKKLLKFILLGLALFILLFPVVYVYHCVQKFYDTIEYSVDEIEKYTAQGHTYKHNFQDKTKENGNYTGLFLCEEELIPLWNLHSQREYHSRTFDNYPFRCVIMRYMTSKGLTKDAEGFAQLSQEDIENIENEIPNYIYADNKLSVYPRVYAIIWELDQYKMAANPNGKTLGQRIDQAILAIDIIKKHFWTGVGLGNSAQMYEDIILESASKLAHQQTGSSHNQYLNYLIRFGIFGALYILGILTYIFIKGRKNNPFLITIFFVSMLAANLGEANWETFIGLSYFAFFICFLMWLMPSHNPYKQ
jgi:hypothetical protein